MTPAVMLPSLKDGARVAVASLVLIRQQPGTASGVIFETLEDETGIVNAIIWPSLFAKQRREVLTATMLGVHGRLQREGDVIHVIADRLVDLGHILRGLTELDGPFETPLPRADEVRRPEPGSLRLVYGEGRNFK
ncbi:MULTISPECIES: OB-fold nucleic acid binding domain-containing protein [Nitrospirillum]|nr:MULTISPECIES: OB-fold nucleic acid binding domain-containing protein [Nitrospirillum]MEA1673976.1 OB-fold nucleic acid binding domain-containing protein [Nitrospirillum sp. BR 11163]